MRPPILNPYHPEHFESLIHQISSAWSVLNRCTFLALTCKGCQVSSTIYCPVGTFNGRPNGLPRYGRYGIWGSHEIIVIVFIVFIVLIVV